MKKITILVMLTALLAICINFAPASAEEKKADEPKQAASALAAKTEEIKVERISPKEIYEGVQTGETLLVCAYSDDAKFAKVHLKGAVSFKEFESKLKDTDKKKLMVFYCG